MTYNVGSIGAFAAWTKRVVHDAECIHEHPRQWFDSTATAQRASANSVSAEAMVKLLSPDNLAMLGAIDRHKPASLHELANLMGRKEASLSRTLKRLAQAGIVAFEDGPHRRRVPSLIATRVHLEIDLIGTHRAVVLN